MNQANDLRWRLDGKTAIVTGATKGIGRAAASDLLGLGAKVLIVARNSEEVAEAVSDWKKRNLPAFGFAGDVSTGEGRQSVLAEAEKQFGGLDILINNVGTNIRKASLEYTGEEYQSLWQTNVASAFETARLSHPLLLKSETASIVNVVSVAGIVSVGTGTIYGMTKAALIQMTRGLAVEWGKDNIRVNAVAPWFTETPLTKTLLAQEQMRQAIVARTPLGKIAAPEDVAGIIAFLCLPAASYITGQCVAADGGFLAKGF
jgi:Tropinone reductase 1